MPIPLTKTIRYRRKWGKGRRRRYSMALVIVREIPMHVKKYNEKGRGLRECPVWAGANADRPRKKTV
jgi:hypothetical protein